MKKIKSTIKSINISHLFAGKLNHGISQGVTDWKIFEPSKFIYSFFTFNMIYEIDWKQTFNRNRIWDYRNDSVFTSFKIENLLEFIYNKTSKSFKDYYLKYDQHFDLVDNSEKISQDYNIGRTGYSKHLDVELSYHENYKVALNNFKKDNFNISDHYKILMFSYQIRNNIFHGLKKATEIIDGGQRKRLLDYSHIILATNEMFFDVLKEHYNYQLAKEDEMKENAGYINY